MFLGHGGDKEFVVKGYVDASFDTNLDDSKSRSRCETLFAMGFDFLDFAPWWPHGVDVSREGFSDEKRGEWPKTEETTMEWANICHT